MEKGAFEKENGGEEVIDMFKEELPDDSEELKDIVRDLKGRIDRLKNLSLVKETQYLEIKIAYHNEAIAKHQAIRDHLKADLIKNNRKRGLL